MSRFSRNALPMDPAEVVPPAVLAAALITINDLRTTLFGWPHLDRMPPGYTVSACQCPVARALSYKVPPVLLDVPESIATAWDLHADVNVSAARSTLWYRRAQDDAQEIPCPEAVARFIAEFDS